MAVMTGCRVVAVAPVEAMAKVADILVRFVVPVSIVVAMRPTGSGRRFAAVLTKMALKAFLVQIMAVSAIRQCSRPMKINAVFIKPRLAQNVV